MIMILITIFFRRLIPGLSQSNGKANGPRHKKAIINKFVLKYHFFCDFLFKNSPQYLHLIALNFISSAQNGHIFVVLQFSSFMLFPDLTDL